jgi:DNA-binding transcriptional MerR regulator
VRSNSSTNRLFFAGELARLAGVSPDTVRYYERRGLLPAAPRSVSGYRIFPREALARVQLIRGALSIGFSVSELAAIFCERDRGGAPCHRVRKLAAEKLVTLEARIRDLRAWRRELRSTLAQWDRLLVKTPRGRQARLLDAFAATHTKSHTRRSAMGFLAHAAQKQEKQL